MNYGAKYIRWAPFKTGAEGGAEPAGKLPVYGEAVTLGKLNKLTENPSFNEAKGYGSNSLAVYLNKFKEATLSVETTEVPRSSMSAVCGTTLEDDQLQPAGGSPSKRQNMRFRDSDKAPYGGLACYVNKILDDGRDVCVGIYYPKTKAMLQGVEYNTNGENITLSTSKLQFTASSCGSADWKIESDYFDNEDDAQAWVDGMLDGTRSAGIGAESYAALSASQKIEASTSSKAAKL